MNDDLLARLESESSELRRRALEIDKATETRDTAMLMKGLATAISALAATAGRLDGPSGLGKSGD
ncbi:hypothetical protein GB928_004275 [Shinella curvata]|uniref:Uncharacterized protein n=1 Tax=Shinella curvata TaxID=1817964 RepID=A0ABT8X9R4_9HYPH|nr:hypothetical protein [Shinella curvata]MCJ8051660.1 hypothetical protein [Shinella curvata]MDO6120392.1 hypothetical protein [Shinella curvata]